MRTIAVAAALATLAAFGPPAQVQAQPADEVNLPLDRSVTVGGVEVACTGVGQTRTDPKWQAFPVRVEFSDSRQEYLGSGAVTVFADRRRLLSVRCDAPWILLKLQPGAYRIEGRVPGSPARPRSAGFHTPARGQMRLVLQFPDA